MKVNFVYCGSNPLLRRLAEALKPEMEVNVKEIALKDTPAGDREPSLDLRRSIEALEGPIVTDHGFEEIVEKITGIPPVNAYGAIQWQVRRILDITTKLQPVIDEIRANHREPVALQNFLGHHFRLRPIYHDEEISFPEDERQVLDRIIEAMGVQNDEGYHISDEIIRIADLYSAVLKREFNVPVITRDAFQYEQNSVREASLKGNVLEVIRKLGMQPEDIVLLVDHHIYRIREDDLQNSGLTEVEVVPICRCCIGVLGMRPQYGPLSDLDLAWHGFKLFPLEHREDLACTVANLKQMIAKAR